MEPFGWMNRIWVVAITLGFTATSCTLQGRGQGPRLLPAAEPAVATKATLQAAYGQLPLSFEANQGQSDAQVQFLARGHGYSLFLTPSEAVLALRQPSGTGESEKRGSGELEIPAIQPPAPSPQHPLVLRLQLVGANANPQVKGLEELPGKVNYFLGNDPSRWRTNIPTYAKVKYQGVYPGVNLVYYGHQGQVEYDFIVTPGADPSMVRLAFADLGGAGLNPAPPIDTNGDRLLPTAGNGRRTSIAVAYPLRSCSEPG